ncbi:MAG: hypothetical protein KIS73_29100 [Enhydrobacter sp.]|nr:hypothetical protein [Enhydrobacter sp.]
MTKDQAIDSALKAFDDRLHEFEIFMDGISRWFATHPKLAKAEFPAIHSVKARLKNRDHLHKKILRKWKDDDPISAVNVFDRMNDLAGVRVLHIHQAQFASIHKEISNHSPTKAITRATSCGHASWRH